jgi:hypothetical protein
MIWIILAFGANFYQQLDPDPGDKFMQIHADPDPKHWKKKPP